MPAQRFYVGRWTRDRGGLGGGGGVSTIELDAGGRMTLLGHALTDVNAGYLRAARDSSRLYVVDERKSTDPLGLRGGRLLTASSNHEGRIELRQEVPSCGAFPAYVAIDNKHQRVAVANHGSYDANLTTEVVDGRIDVVLVYDDGSVCIFPIDAEGDAGQASGLRTLPRGHGPLDGPDSILQQSCHPHSVIFVCNDEFLLVCEKGTDTIFVLDPSSLDLPIVSRAKAPPGSAPRHAVYNEATSMLYVITERRSLILAYKLESGQISPDPLVSLPTIPAGYGEVSRPAEIRLHPSGRYLYTSNRGHDSIAAFALDQYGDVKLSAIFEINAQTPRGFGIDPTGQFMVVGAQDSNVLISLHIDDSTGHLIHTNRSLNVDRPVCVEFPTG